MTRTLLNAEEMDRYAVIFDMDGVIFDTERLLIRSWVPVAERHGIEDIEGTLTRCIGLKRELYRQIMHDAYGEDFPLEEYEKEVSVFFHEEADTRGIPVKDGAREILRALAGRGVPMALASSTRYEIVNRELEQAGLLEFFDVVIGGDMVERSKPEPDIFLEAAGRLGADPACCYVIEDSPNGIRAAHAAGMTPLMVPDVITPDEEIRGLAEKIFGSLSEVELYLKDRHSAALAEQAGLTIFRDEEGLALAGNGMTLRADLREMLPRIQPGRLAHEMLARAARIKGTKEPSEEGRLLAVDATAGFAEDSIILAAAGYRVIMYERDPVIAALLADALERAAADPELSGCAARMELREEDSVQAMRDLEERPDVILLDPMFPERRKSGLIKKKFQLLQKLERPCADEEALLKAALAAGPRKVIIKRPLKGPCLAGRDPSYSLKGRSIRYDCIVIPREDG